MPALPINLRNLLERTVISAHDEAEKAAKASLIRLAVHQSEPYTTLSQSDRDLRERLRAEARRLGEASERQNRDLTEPNEALVVEVAYAQWHRMLFARFLAENALLMHPTGVPVTLAECADLAADEGEPDGWMLASRYASAMLPGIFRQDDPVTQVRFDAAGRLALEQLLNNLPDAVFTAEDSLGWVYQFWQARQKEIVNKSGRKIGGADIAPVTQLFTEHYMVQFLLHNSLGAWWAARHPQSKLPLLARNERSGEGRGEVGNPPLPAKSPTERGDLGSLVGERDEGLTYLRLNEDGSPAADSFDGWPERAADLRILDPCCGSGHFLVAAFALLCRIRMQEEELNEREAGDAVIRDNLFGLEIDPRCTQIAAFNLALYAWKAGGYRELPLPNIACSGLPVGANSYEFTHLAQGDTEMEATLRRLHHLFRQAPDLGSLIDPERVAREDGKLPYTESLFALKWDEISEKLEKALANQDTGDPAAAIFGATAKGVARAADLLSRHYHLVITNVPYLARGKQDIVLRTHIETYHNDAKADLATAFVDRGLRLCSEGATLALVTPQNWLFLKSYAGLRRRLLTEESLNVIARLGSGAFETIGGEVVNVVLLVLTTNSPAVKRTFFGIDASVPHLSVDKGNALRLCPISTISQFAQLHNPTAKITLETLEQGPMLSDIVTVHYGSKPGQTRRVTRYFWEVENIHRELWTLMESTPDVIGPFRGKSEIAMSLERIQGEGITEFGIRGKEAWGRRGVVLSQMRNLPCSLYLGEFFDNNTSVIIPTRDSDLTAVYMFMCSDEFRIEVRKRNQKLDVDTNSMIDVPFKLERWTRLADESYSNGLPEPHSDDPSQWLFRGNPARSTDPLHAATARLLGYRWPQNESDELGKFADTDGIVCLPPIAGEPPAAQRLREFLASAFGTDWTAAIEERLLSEAGFGDCSLEEWLRGGFFAQHCKLFHNRPFLWHIWDGNKEGFSAIVNYHKLNRAKLDRLIYTYLGDWIGTQRHADAEGIAGANAKLVAALNLQKKLITIAEGEPPYDIYIRWKPLHKQPLGWEPDVNDGVRLNIRPFVTAGALRSKFTVNWNKDPGTNPDGTERFNDVHLERKVKEAARKTFGLNTTEDLNLK